MSRIFICFFLLLAMYRILEISKRLRISSFEKVLRNNNRQCLVNSLANNPTNVFINILTPFPTYAMIRRHFNGVCERSRQIEREESLKFSYDDRNVTLMYVEDRSTIAILIGAIFRDTLETMFPRTNVTILNEKEQKSTVANGPFASNITSNFDALYKTILLNVNIEENRTSLQDALRTNAYCTDSTAVTPSVRGTFDNILLSILRSKSTAIPRHLATVISCEKTQWFEWNITVRSFAVARVPFAIHEIDTDVNCDDSPPLNNSQRNVFLQHITCNTNDLTTPIACCSTRL